MDDLLELAVSENLDLVGWMRADGWTVSCESRGFRHKHQFAFSLVSQFA